MDRLEQLPEGERGGGGGGGKGGGEAGMKTTIFQNVSIWNFGFGLGRGGLEYDMYDMICMICKVL